MEQQIISDLSSQFNTYLQVLTNPNTYAEYGLAIVAFFVTYSALRIAKAILYSRLEKIAKKTANRFDDTLVEMLGTLGTLFYFAASIFVASQFLTLSPDLELAIYYFLLFTITYYAVRAGQKMVDYLIKKLIEQRKAEEGENEDVSLIRLANQLINWSLWIFGSLIFISNIGIDITPLLAGVSIGGVAIAFGLQAILGDIFASFSIYFDKPFKVGDYIVVGSDDGTVRRIGIKSTRIQTLRGEELIISNKELTNTRINNFKKMRDRRVYFKLGVTYDTPVAKLQKIPKIIEGVITKTASAKFDRCHFKEYGDSALGFVVVYYVKSRDYVKYLDVNQKINLGIAKEFQKHKIDFAYPTQTIYVKK